MAGHAFLDSFQKSTPDAQAAYLGDGGGTKIALSAKSEPVLRALYAAAQDRGIPCSIIDDDEFGGAVAVGIGPASREDCRPLTKRFQLMK